MQYPLGFAIVLVLAVSAGGASLARNSDFLASLCASLLVICLIVATLHARFGDPQARRFFWGFALAGWIYAIVSCGPLSSQARASLVTEMMIARALPPPPADPNLAVTWRIDRERGHQVGHMLFTLAAGITGGLFALRVGEPPGRQPVAT